MNVAQIREAAGLTAEQLPDDASPEQVAAALRTAPEPTAEKPPAEPQPDEGDGGGDAGGGDGSPPEPEQEVAAKAGTTTIDASELNRLRAAAEKAERLDQEARDSKRDKVISAAIEAGKFGRGRRDHWVKAWAADPEGTEHLLTAKEEDGGLASGLVPRHEIGGVPQEDDDALKASQGTGLFTFEEEGK